MLIQETNSKQHQTTIYQRISEAWLAPLKWLAAVNSVSIPLLEILLTYLTPLQRQLTFPCGPSVAVEGHFSTRKPKRMDNTPKLGGGVLSNRQRFSAHPHSQPYNSTCLRCHKKKVFHDKQHNIYWSLCLGCLSETQLGPFRQRYHPFSYDN